MDKKLAALDSIKTEQDVIDALKNKSQFERDVLVATYKIPKGKVSTYKRIAERIILETIRSMMSFLSTNSQNDIDGKHKVTYALVARIENDEGSYPVEVLELAPEGGSLASGVPDWWNNEFWWNSHVTEQSHEPDG